VGKQLTRQGKPMRDSDSDGRLMNILEVLQATCDPIYLRQASIFCNCGDSKVNGSAFNPFVKGNHEVNCGSLEGVYYIFRSNSNQEGMIM